MYLPDIATKIKPYYSLAPNLDKLKTQQEIDEFFMNVCLDLTFVSRQLDEVPVTAIIVKDNKIIGIGINCTITNNDASAHAEIMAIRDAGRHLNNYRLLDTTIYVTLEPCPMCSGAIMHARCSRIVYSTKDEKTGSLGSKYHLFEDFPMNHFPQITNGISPKLSQNIIVNYFKSKRVKKEQK